MVARFGRSSTLTRWALRAVLLLALPAAAATAAGAAHPPPAAPAQAPAPLPAAAPGSGEKSDGDIAREFFKEGLAEYELGHYQEGLALFEKAYKKKSVPALLYNIAQCHRQLGDLKMARATYKTFIAKQPDSPMAKVAKENLVEVEHALEVQSAVRTASPTELVPPAAEPKGQGEAGEEPRAPAATKAKAEPAAVEPGVAAAKGPAAKPEPAKPQASKAPEPAKETATRTAAALEPALKEPTRRDVPKPVVVVAVKPEPAEGTAGLKPPLPAPPVALSGSASTAAQPEGDRTVTWIAGGAAVVALGAGGFFALQSQGTASDISSTPRTGPEVQQLNDQMRSQASKANLLLRVGVGLVAVAGVCFALRF